MNLVAGDPDLSPLLEYAPPVLKRDHGRAVIRVAQMAVFLREGAHIFIACDVAGDGLSAVDAGCG